jgi:biotin carboxylase
MADPRRVLLLIASTSYKATDFLEAAGRLGVAVTVGSDHEATLAEEAPGGTLALDFSDSAGSLAAITELHAREPFAAVVAAEDEGVELAAVAARELGLEHNPPEAVHACRRKDLFREKLSKTDLLAPWYEAFPEGAGPSRVAGQIPYPCVVKPVALAASRGVIRANGPSEFVAAFQRVVKIMRAARGDRGDAPLVLVESYIPGSEVALEGLLIRGELRTLAILDKPDPLVGPFFEETLFVTPSRLDTAVQSEIERVTGRVAAAIGLHEGPVHAELRVNDEGVWVIELAPRTIGGLCSRIFRYRAGVSLEELVLRHALDGTLDELAEPLPPSGVMMIPIPRSGRLEVVSGVEDAEAVEGVQEVVMSLLPGQEVVPLPEGNRYLGFIFARGESAPAVESALREAHDLLDIRIEPTGSQVSPSEVGSG